MEKIVLLQTAFRQGRHPAIPISEHLEQHLPTMVQFPMKLGGSFGEQRKELAVKELLKMPLPQALAMKNSPAPSSPVAARPTPNRQG